MPVSAGVGSKGFASAGVASNGWASPTGSAGLFTERLVFVLTTRPSGSCADEVVVTIKLTPTSSANRVQRNVAYRFSHRMKPGVLHRCEIGDIRNNLKV